MIRVTIETCPRGATARAREIARMTITGISDRAAARDYEISASSSADARSGRPAFEASGNVITHRREDSIWALVAQAAGWVAASAEK